MEGIAHKAQGTAASHLGAVQLVAFPDDGIEGGKGMSPKRPFMEQFVGKLHESLLTELRQEAY